MSVKFLLPYPPSVNRYWRRRGNSYFIEAPGRAYRSNVEAIVVDEQIKPQTGLLAIYARVFPPDKRARDGDNLWKAILDSLVHCRVIESDSNRVLRKETLEWANVFTGGFVEIEIQQYDGQSGGGFKRTEY